jgi:hypothetical protein
MVEHQLSNQEEKQQRLTEAPAERQPQRDESDGPANSQEGEEEAEEEFVNKGEMI